MPRNSLIVALTCTALGATAVPVADAAPPAALRAPEVWAIGPGSTIKVDGHGYGHGRGMSQYGSEGGARQGLTSTQIMEFYYPGTTVGQARGQVKVWISTDRDNVLTVVRRTGLAVRNLVTKQKTMLPDKNATRWRMTAGTGTKTVVSFYRGGWVRWRTLPGDAEFTAGGSPITLVLPAGKVAYRGGLASRAPKPGKPKRVTVNRLPLESYLRGVVPRETFTSWHQAALESQAIAARTYAAFERANPLSSIYQICDTTSCQVYGGFSAEYASTNKAIDATKFSVRLDSAGKPAFTQFSSSNGGWTVAGSQPYLVAKKDPYDGWSGNPNSSWTLPLTAGNVERNYPTIGTLTSISIDTRDGHGDMGGRVLKMTLKGTGGTATTTGEDFRFRVGLKSSWFTLRVS
ncbi:MAG: SpoIID/LytB domain-containing protein [Nocardioides sp.]